MEIVKDKNGKVLGFIKESGRETIATNTNGKIVGIYNPVTNLTKDANLRIISTGNSVISQLFR